MLKSTRNLKQPKVTLSFYVRVVSCTTLFIDNPKTLSIVYPLQRAELLKF